MSDPVDLPGTGTLEAAVERACAWMEAHLPNVLPDAVLTTSAGLSLLDKDRARDLRRAYSSKRRLRFDLPAEYLATVEQLGDLLTEDPRPVQLSWQPGRGSPDAPGSTARERLSVPDAAESNRALREAVKGHLGHRLDAWISLPGTSGYYLTHQLFTALVLCKSNPRSDRARERAGLVARRLSGQLERGWDPQHHDLLAESVAMLGLAGAVPSALRRELAEILAAQDADDGGWFFESPTASEPPGLDRIGEPPECGFVKPRWTAGAGDRPHLQLEYLQTVLRGHSTGLGIWALSLFRYRLAATPGTGGDAC